MRGTLLLVVGIGLGFAAAHQINSTPGGRRFFDDVRTRAQEFGDAVVDGYRTREAELRADDSADAR